jgi:hypothetical protein
VTDPLWARWLELRLEFPGKEPLHTSEALRRIVDEQTKPLHRQIAALEHGIAARDRLRAVVVQQAEDEGLWFVAKTAPEAYLQQELRKLHAAIEESSNAVGTPPAAKSL